MGVPSQADKRAGAKAGASLTEPGTGQGGAYWWSPARREHLWPAEQGTPRGTTDGGRRRRVGRAPRAPRHRHLHWYRYGG